MIGRIIADRYRLEERAGEGGIGAVYRARHLLIDRIVAVKVLQPVRRGETHHRDWFLREARAANRVNHANIVDIYDFGDTEDGLYYLVMEYLMGEPLSHAIGQGPMAVPRVIDIIEQTCAALARAHDLGVVHRDIKSDNVFLLDRGGRHDYVKVFDFGLASLAKDPRLAPAGAVFGTPEYMSPEQTRGEDATPASDLYALGVLFFEMLAGRLPFVSRDRQRLLTMHQEEIPPNASKYVDDLPPPIDDVINRLMAKEPSDRFKDAHHVHEEIKHMQRATPRKLSWGPIRDARGSSSAKMPVTSGVAAWTMRSVMFGRMVASAGDTVALSPLVRRALEDMWRLCTDAARVEGEMSKEASRVDRYERRGRDVRAQLGRQIAEIAGEESKLKRRRSELEVRLQRTHDEHGSASRRLERAWTQIGELEAQGDEKALLWAHQEAGAERARVSASSQEIVEFQSEIDDIDHESREREARLKELRDSLNTQADEIDRSLNTVRNRMATAGRDRAQIVRDLERSAQTLFAELAPIEALTPLFREMESLVGPMKQRIRTNDEALDPPENATLISGIPEADAA